MLKVIVFDCDGVMFDSKELNRQYYDSLLIHFGHAKMDEQELDYVHINSLDNCLKHIFRNHHESIEEINKLRETIDYKSFLPYLQMEPDLISFLDAVHNKYQLAISTNRSDTMEIILEKFELESYFEKVMTAANAKKAKPAPDALLEILQYFKIKPEEAIHIGDSIIDEIHARDANVPLVAFKNKNLNTPHHVNNFLEILDLPVFQH
ncbi:MAG: HAD-IA family hydrolase [Desulfotalea sp.]